jgi:uncharacterized protein YbaP (TraB family)
VSRAFWAALAAVVLGFIASAAQAAPAMWRVSGPAAQIYLFGTLHALNPAVQWRTPAYDAAYKAANVVWFEADVGGADPVSMSLILNRYGVDPAKGLSEKLAPADLDALRPTSPASTICAPGRRP